MAKPKTLCMPTAAVLHCKASWNQPLLVTAFTPMSFLTIHSSAATQYRCTATRPRTLCMLTTAVLHCKAKVGTSLACVCLHTYRVVDYTQLCNTQYRCTATRPRTLSMPTAAVRTARQVGTSLACVCLHTYGFLDYTQLCSHPVQMHIIKAQDPVHAHLQQCCTARQKLEPALLVCLPSHLWVS